MILGLSTIVILIFSLITCLRLRIKTITRFCLILCHTAEDTFILIIMWHVKHYKYLNNLQDKISLKTVLFATFRKILKCNWEYFSKLHLEKKKTYF